MTRARTSRHLEQNFPQPAAPSSRARPATTNILRQPRTEHPQRRRNRNYRNHNLRIPRSARLPSLAAHPNPGPTGSLSSTNLPPPRPPPALPTTSVRARRAAPAPAATPQQRNPAQHCPETPRPTMRTPFPNPRGAPPSPTRAARWGGLPARPPLAGLTIHQMTNLTTSSSQSLSAEPQRPTR